MTGAILGKTGDAKCQADAQLFVIAGERQVKRIQHLRNDTLCSDFDVADRLQQDAEVVAAEASQ